MTIYELLMIKEGPILVCSPQRNNSFDKKMTSKTFSALLRVNKKINDGGQSNFLTVFPILDEARK
jgi:hypothetical protein